MGVPGARAPMPTRREEVEAREGWEGEGSWRSELVELWRGLTGGVLYMVAGGVDTRWLSSSVVVEGTKSFK